MSDGISMSHPVATLRQEMGWTQAGLGTAAGLPRSSVSAIESGRLVPSVSAALAISRALGRPVEELFGGPVLRAEMSAPEWAWSPQGDACRYWQAEVGGRHLRFPVEPLFHHPVAHDGVVPENGLHSAAPDLAEKTLVLACCDPAAGLLAAQYARLSGFRMLVFHRGGKAALELLKAGVVHIAGLHRSTEEYPERNAESARATLGRGWQLLRVARWQAGIAVSAENRRQTVNSLLKQNQLWALREEGSAARECLNELSGKRRPKGRIVDGHVAVAQAVRSGWAGAGVCVELAAREAGLDFLPLHFEDLDFCYSAAVKHDPRLSALLQLLRSREHRRLVSELPGYDTTTSGLLVKV